MTERIGLLGGSFNPPHYGHLRPALEAMEYLRLDRVLFMPSGGHPFKDADQLAPVVHRLAMTRLALQQTSAFAPCTIEAERSGISYTIDTLNLLTQQMPEAEFFLLLGSDLLHELHLWRHWQSLIHHAHLCLLVREGWEQAMVETTAYHYFSAFAVADPAALSHQRQDRYGWIVTPVSPLGISSSDLRRRLRQGKSIRYLTPEPVVEYIYQHQLYREVGL